MQVYLTKCWVFIVLLGVLWAPHLFAWGKLAEVPQNVDRFITCPIETKPSQGMLGGVPGQWLTYKDHDFSQHNWWEPFQKDLASLETIFPKDQFLVTAVDIRNLGGHFGFRYVGNGGSHVAVSPWSSSKWLAVLSAMRRFHEFGIGSHSSIGTYDLGDLITTSHTGFATPTVKGIDSNYIGTLFQNLGGRQQSDQLIKEWLKRPNESFASGYGGAVPQTPLTVMDLDTKKSTQITPSAIGGGVSRISTLTFAEALKRIATHEDSWNNVPFPGITTSDLSLLFYGHPHREIGGMLAAYEEAVRQALGSKDHLDKATNGKWRIFTKTGSASWYTGEEQLVNGIICLPGFDGGRLLAVSFYVKGPVRKAGLKRLQAGFKLLMNHLVPGFSSAID